MMKKLLFSLMFVLVANVAVADKNNDSKAEKFQKRCKAKAAALQKQLMLDDATAAWFTPLYVEYLGKLHEACGQDKQKVKQEATDKEILAQMNDCLDRQENIIKIKRNYLKKFEQKLTPRQLKVVMKPMGNMGGHRPMHMGKKAPNFGKQKAGATHHKRFMKKGKQAQCPLKGHCDMTPQKVEKSKKQ